MPCTPNNLEVPKQLAEGHYLTPALPHYPPLANIRRDVSLVSCANARAFDVLWVGETRQLGISLLCLHTPGSQCFRLRISVPTVHNSLVILASSTR